MERDPKKYLCDMLDRGQFVNQLLSDRTLENLESDRVLRSAVERELMVLGEALYQLHQIAPEVAQQIDRWRSIIGFRHVLVHGYAALDLRTMWDAIKNDLPSLIQQIEPMLEEEL